MLCACSYRISTKNGWKSVLLRTVNRTCINSNRLQLKWLIPIEHDLNDKEKLSLILISMLQFHTWPTLQGCGL